MFLCISQYTLSKSCMRPDSHARVVSVASTVVKGAWNRGAGLGSSRRSLGVRWPHGNAGIVYWILLLCQSLSVFHLILILITALRGASCPGSLMRKWGPGVQGLTPHHLAYGRVFSACFQLPSLPLCCMGRSWINGKEANIEKTLPRPSPWCF